MSRAQLIAGIAFGLGAALVIFLSLIKVDLANVRVQQALVAGIVVSSGWLMTFLLREASVLLDRRERRRDMIRAVRAEVELIKYFAEKMDWDEAMRDIRAAYDEDPDYKPLIAYGRQFAVMRRLVAEIEILDTEPQIRAVIDMYQLLDRLEQLEQRISDAEFSQISTDRRVEAVIRYLKMQQALPEVANRVLSQLPRKGAVQ
jgi:hypothetical protein